MKAISNMRMTYSEIRHNSYRIIWDANAEASMDMIWAPVYNHVIYGNTPHDMGRPF